MSSISILEPRFVEILPPVLEGGVLYVTMAFNTVVHNCCCGCGNRVVTPLSPAGWQLQYDGRSVTLYPSIGNHQYACRSHYWIRQNQVEWSYALTPEEIEESRIATSRERTAAFDQTPVVTPRAGDPKDKKKLMESTAWWERLKRRWR